MSPQGMSGWRLSNRRNKIYQTYSEAPPRIGHATSFTLATILPPPPPSVSADIMNGMPAQPDAQKARRWSGTTFDTDIGYESTSRQ